jgi:predicted ATP-dependent serine protease
MAVRAVIRCLQVVGRLPENYSLGMPQCHVPSNAHRLVGRQAELQELLDGLRERGCVVISGGPGEGKTALAQEAVQTLWSKRALPGGAYVVDLNGESSFLAFSHHHTRAATRAALLHTRLAIAEWHNRRVHRQVNA